jgi:hypothetical protein
MKTTDSRDPLDRQIDTLLAARPLQPSSDFSARVLAATDALTAKQQKPRPLAQLLRFALPLAAVVAVAFALAQQFSANPDIASEPTLTTSDIQEIFLLEDGLSALAQIENDDLASDDLLITLEALYFDIRS